LICAGVKFGYVRLGNNVVWGVGVAGLLNQALSKVFTSKGEEARGDWRKLRNLHSSPEFNGIIKSRRTEMGGACGTYKGE